MEPENEQTTLHDTLSAAFEAEIPDVPVGATAAPEATSEVVTEPPDGETPEAKEARERDEKGRFAAAKKSAAEPAKTATTTPQASAAPPAPAAEPAKALARPSSWKKEMWPIWDKLATGLPLNAQESRQAAEYNLQRETEAARGVSAYKAEYDRAKPLVQAYDAHRADFERWGIDPGVQFSKYVEIHKGLALGTEEQKLSTFLRLAQDYKIPVEKMFVQQNGQIFFNPQVQPAAPQPQAPAVNAQSIEATVQAVIAKERTTSEIVGMEKDTVKFPHFAAVRNTMGQLVDAGVASPDDLPGAYDMALALPQHRDLLAQQQQQHAAQAEADRKAKAVADAQRARAAAASPKSATPAAAPTQARKGLRDTITDNFDAMGAGRV